MIIQKDNFIIEVERSGNGNPPGVKGMAPNHSSSWFRVNNGKWIHNPFRSFIELCEYLIKLEDDEVETFIQLIEEDDK